MLIQFIAKQTAKAKIFTLAAKLCKLLNNSLLIHTNTYKFGKSKVQKCFMYGFGF